ncbi:MAG: serine/threonine protein kinase [Deltaproteobacteria bacterium]|nr:serine/threonine protein kinase [Deltaproteobacteria bacterium]
MPQTPGFKILRKLDAGGMAEVYHAEQESIEGFRKTVAVKKVLPHLVQNEKFLRMFLDEARLSLRMSHANVVQVFNVAKAGGSYYVIMEFVDGTNLKGITEFMRSRRTLIPIEQAVFVMVETCKGLQYAHTLTDRSGRALGIVHRDVSPPNILLSKQGEVKLVDFGLAKAADQLEHTDPGVVKGKFSYLSPEAVEGQTVDCRADIFAAGILLYEMLSGRRLFQGKTDYETVQQVRVAEIPPLSRINPAVPRDLERIVLRALAKDLRQRYQSAQEFGDDLYQFLFSHGLKVTAFDIAGMVKTVMNESAGPARGGGSAGIIDELIETELQKLTSLEEGDSPFRGGQKPLSVEEISGAGTGSMDSLEDPRGWAGELDDGAALRLPQQPGGAAVWRESMPTPLPFRAVKEPRAGGPARPEPRAPARPPDPEPAPPRKKSRTGLLVGVLVVLAAVLGVLVWLAFFRDK